MLKSILQWVRLSLEGLRFKVKSDLPESPPQEIQSSNSDSNIISKALDEGSKAKQEKQQWFTKANDLRMVDFDLNPVWDNHHQLYGTADNPGDDFYRFKKEDEEGYKPSTIKEIEGGVEEYVDSTPKSYSPWDDLEKFPLKDYKLNQEELNQLKPVEDGNNNSNA